MKKFGFLFLVFMMLTVGVVIACEHCDQETDGAAYSYAPFEHGNDTIGGYAVGGGYGKYSATGKTLAEGAANSNTHVNGDNGSTPTSAWSYSGAFNSSGASANTDDGRTKVKVASASEQGNWAGLSGSGYYGTAGNHTDAVGEGRKKGNSEISTSANTAASGGSDVSLYETPGSRTVYVSTYGNSTADAPKNTAVSGTGGYNGGVVMENGLAGGAAEVSGSMYYNGKDSGSLSGIGVSNVNITHGDNHLNVNSSASSRSEATGCQLPVLPKD